MNKEQNRDDLIKRVIDQKRKWKRGELTPKEKSEAVKHVVEKILPRVYEGRKE